ncbi:MAG: histidine kinase, partial [Saprospiraceae bacterium]|nr:histidine kinase [Saprospiraceae bacterium]
GSDVSECRQITELDGVRLHNIRAIAIQDSIVWLGMNAGLGRFDPRANSIQLFTDRHGLIHSEIHGLTFGENRQLYAGTAQGVSFVDVDTLEQRLNKRPPQVYFTDFSVNGVRESELISGNPHAGYTLAYPLNSFMVSYAAVGFTLPERQQYAYQLEGVDDQFNLVGTRQFTSYNNLDPGRYLLRVKAANSMGYWNEQGAVLPIYIKPAFWQTLGFRIGLGLVLAGLLYGGYRYRIAQVRRESRLVMEFNQKLASAESQALRAQMNPHFIFNALNSIKLYMMDRDPREASGYLDDFARLVRLVLQNSKETLISLEKELEALELYIQMEKLRFEKEFTHHIEVDPDLDASFFEVPPLLLQPYVENAIWHGFMALDHPGTLTIRAHIHNDRLQIDIIDNGIGRVRAAELKQARPAYKKSMGMQITAERMELHKTLSGKQITVQIHDLVDAEGKAAGTHVQIEVAASG